MNPKEQLAGLVRYDLCHDVDGPSEGKPDVMPCPDGRFVAADDLAAILATLPEPGVVSEEDEVVCLECGQPTMHMGQVCYACSHPAAKPSEAQAQGGGEVVAWDNGSPCMESRPIGMVYPVKPAPRASGYLDSSGVEWNAYDTGQMEAYARAAYSDGWGAGYRAALAQQPAADAYCITREDGECISDDPRCMHNKPAAVDESLPDFLDRIADELVSRDTRAGTFAPGMAESLRGRAIVLRTLDAPPGGDRHE